MMRFLPEPGAATAPFWNGTAQGELRLQRCNACQHWQFYPRNFCTACGALDLDWAPASGNGTLRSFTIVRRPVTEAYAPDVPYVIALVALAEGPTLMTQLVDVTVPAEGADAAASGIIIGAPVQVQFVPWTDTVTMPMFRLSS